MNIYVKKLEGCEGCEGKEECSTFKALTHMVKVYDHREAFKALETEFNSFDETTQEEVIFYLDDKDETTEANERNPLEGLLRELGVI